MNALSNPTPSLVDLISGYDLRDLGGKITTYFGNNYLNLLSLVCAYTAAVVSASNAARQLPNEPPPC